MTKLEFTEAIAVAMEDVVPGFLKKSISQAKAMKLAEAIVVRMDEELDGFCDIFDDIDMIDDDVESADPEELDLDNPAMDDEEYDAQV